MALHPKFPKFPYEILNPDIRWFPADEALREKDYGKLLPPLVAKLRKEVKAWRDSGYKDASVTSRTLLNWWFRTDHHLPQDDLNILRNLSELEATKTIIETFKRKSCLAKATQGSPDRGV